MNPKLHHRIGDYANDAFAGKVINVRFYSLLKTPFTYCPFMRLNYTLLLFMAEMFLKITVKPSILPFSKSQNKYD